jgi:hypothetical protein
MECRVYLSTFNHADTDAIVVAVEQAPWREREMVQLFLKEQEEELFSLRYCGSAQQQPAVRGFFKHELEIINNALNEVCNGVQLEGEFETRMGCSLQEPQSLLAKVHALAAK